MTIAVAVRTGSAVIFAADSKVTTQGVIGILENGEPHLVEQTYDNAVKVVHDTNRNLMAMVAGHANIGLGSAMDFIMARSFDGLPGASRDEQDALIRGVVDTMLEQKKAHWSTTDVPPEKWPGPTLLLAAACALESAPRVWRVDLEGEGATINEILTRPRIWLEGSYGEVFSLLYGHDLEFVGSVGRELEIERDKIYEAIKRSKRLMPIDKLNLWTIPIQDAIDLAAFLARVQIQMDRFLPGQPACGGAIDVMVLRVLPVRAILSFPGKVLHHPGPSLPTLGGDV